MSRMNNEKGLGMKDEEMAEESLISYRKEPKWAGKMFMQDENTCYKDGFLAGLKAGRPKWHKVVDGDLPSEEGGWVCNQDGLPCFFDWGTEQWLDCEGTQIRTTEWCHMPHKE